MRRARSPQQKLGTAMASLEEENCEEPAGPREIPGIDGVRCVIGGRRAFAITRGGDCYECGVGASLQLTLDGRKVLQCSAGTKHAALLVTNRS